MAISFTVETKRVTVGKGGYFDVRGLSADDLTYLTAHFLEDLKSMAIDFSVTKFKADQRAEMILAIAKSFPGLCAEVVSRCADASEDDRPQFMRLPFVATIRALKAITDLTLEDGGVELGNLLAAIAAHLDAAGVESGPLMKSLSATISAVAKMSPTS